MVVATTDTMVEGIDFRLDWPGFDLRRLGRRLISINLSDLAGMGATARHALISLALRGETTVSDVRRLYQGIAERAHQYGCTVAGGDLSATSGPLTLSATLVGSVPSPASLLRRRGGRAGWLIAVTGTLGAAAAGLRILESRRPAATPAQRSWVKAQLDPTPQLEAGRLLVEAGVRIGGDISDGLYREAERITQPDRLGASIQVDRLPLAPGLSPSDWRLAVRDSEDFELIAAAPARILRYAQARLERQALRLTVIGTIERRPGIRLRDGDRAVTLAEGGYEHFR